jgi:hypothetical protein
MTPSSKALSEAGSQAGGVGNPSVPAMEQGGSKTAHVLMRQFNKALDLVRTRGARFDSSNDAVRKLSALDEYGVPWGAFIAGYRGPN